MGATTRDLIVDIAADTLGCTPASLKRSIMADLQRITAGRVDFVRMWGARLAICRAIHGLGVSPGPIFRVGSNAPGATRQLDDFDTPEPCPTCGAPEDRIVGGDLTGTGEEHCLDCGETWVCGDFDWRDPADCEAFRRDLSAGRIAYADELRLSERLASPVSRWMGAAS